MPDLDKHDIMSDMSVEAPQEVREEYRSMSTSELETRNSQATAHLEAGAEYSDDEIEQVQERAGISHHPYAYDLARNELMINDYVEQQLTTQALEERKKES